MDILPFGYGLVGAPAFAAIEPEIGVIVKFDAKS
jgi:hypothetical protein